MDTLSYGYRRGSTLPRRSFVVNVTVDQCEYLALDVTAPDALEAENLVRRMLNASSVESFSFDLVREVGLVWNNERGSYSSPLVVVPEGFTGRLTVMHR